MLTYDDEAIFSRSRGEGLTPPITQGVKVQLEGYKKISHILVPIIRLKLTRDEDAAFAYYFVPGFTTKLPIFDPGVKILKFYQGYLGGSTSTSVFRKLMCC